MKRWVAIMACVGMFGQAGAERAEPVLNLSLLVKEVVERHPGLAVVRQKVQAMKALAQSSGKLPEPRLGLGLMNVPVSSWLFADEDMTMKQLSFSQMIMWPGKLAAEGEAGWKTFQQAEAEYRDAENRVIGETRSAYYDWMVVHESSTVVEANIQVLEKFNRIAEAKYRTGQGLQTDVLRASVELAKMKNEWLMLEERRRTVRAKLNTLQHHLADASVAVPEAVGRSAVRLSLEPLRALVKQRNPMLAMARAMVERMEAEKRMAEAAWWPDIEVGASYGFRNPSPTGMVRPDMATAMVSINLPWMWGPQGDRALWRKAEWEQAKAQLVKVEAELELDLGAMAAMIDQLQKTRRLYENDILPQARQSAAQAETNYQVNKVDFLTLLENQMTVFKYEVELWQTVGALQKRLAELEVIVGGEIGYEK